ncbi:MAG: DNA primase [Rhodoferax sp.]|nr:DNA primase [Rhodoferax sp.]
MAIPHTFVQELLARTDVVEVVGQYVQLKKSGTNFTGLCPFHSEKSPSFSVSPAKQFYHCFGCGKSGDAIRFLMEHLGMGFVEAVKDLAQHRGMQIPEDDMPPEELARMQAQRKQQATLTDILEKAGEAYRHALKDSPRAIAYFKKRGLSGAVAKQFGLGYAPDGWRNLASVFAHYDDPLLVECGLVITSTDTVGSEERRYDRFRDRVMFPIRNIKGECIGFGGRVLGDEKPKYLNSPETPVFSKGRELYGLFEARNAVRELGYVLVTEGYMDVVALAQLGFTNAVATLGTACTSEHVQKLFRFSDAVVFSFDGDAAGRRAAHKALHASLPYATDVRSIKFLFLPPEHDPDSFIRANGQQAFAKYVTDAMPLSRFLIEVAREGCDMGSAEGRAHMASNAKPLWTLLPEGVLKLQLFTEIAAQAQLSAQELNKAWIGGSQASGGVHDDFPANAPLPFERVDTRARRHGHQTRSRLLNRSDHVVRIVLGRSELWDTLSGEEHGLLCELPAPHGPLLVWLEVKLHEHGPLAWGVLREALRGHAVEDFATHLMADPLISDHSGNTQDLGAELHDLLGRMLIERIKEQETQAIEAIKTDPSALARYQELRKRRLELMGVIKTGTRQAANFSD